MEYACWGSLAGGFCEKEKISAASPFDRCSFTLFRQSPGSSSSLPSHSSSWMTATLIHSPLTTMVFPLTSNAGTLTHLPPTLISILSSGMTLVLCRAVNRKETDKSPHRNAKSKNYSKQPLSHPLARHLDE